MAETPQHQKGTPASPLKRLLNRLRVMFKPAESGSESEGSRGSPRFFPLFLLLFGAGMIVISLFGEQGLIAYLDLQDETAGLRREVVGMERQRGNLLRKIKALHEDPSYIEFLAREKLGLVKPGEQVIQIRRREAGR